MDASENSIIDIIIYNLQGRKVASIRKSVKTGMNTIALPVRSTGVLLYQIKSPNKTVADQSIFYQKKLSKQGG